MMKKQVKREVKRRKTSRINRMEKEENKIKKIAEK